MIQRSRFELAIRQDPVLSALLQEALGGCITKVQYTGRPGVEPFRPGVRASFLLSGRRAVADVTYTEDACGMGTLTQLAVDAVASIEKRFDDFPAAVVICAGGIEGTDAGILRMTLPPDRNGWLAHTAFVNTGLQGDTDMSVEVRDFITFIKEGTIGKESPLWDGLVSSKGCAEIYYGLLQSGHEKSVGEIMEWAPKQKELCYDTLPYVLQRRGILDRFLSEAAGKKITTTGIRRYPADDLGWCADASGLGDDGTYYQVVVRESITADALAVLIRDVFANAAREVLLSPCQVIIVCGEDILGVGRSDFEVRLGICAADGGTTCPFLGNDRVRVFCSAQAGQKNAPAQIQEMLDLLSGADIVPGKGSLLEQMMDVPVIWDIQKEIRASDDHGNDLALERNENCSNRNYFEGFIKGYHEVMLHWELDMRAVAVFQMYPSASVDEIAGSTGLSEENVVMLLRGGGIDYDLRHQRMY